MCSAPALAAGPLVALAVGIPFFFLGAFALVVRDEDAKLTGAVGSDAEDGLEDGGSPPPSPPALREVDAAAAAAAGAEDEEDEEAGEEEDARALSRLHSSLWPARHVSRWQASLQYFRCRHPEQKRSCWAWAVVPQNAHVAALLFMMSVCLWLNSGR